MSDDELVENDLQRTLATFEKTAPRPARHLYDHIAYRGGEWLYLPSPDDRIEWQIQSAPMPRPNPRYANADASPYLAGPRSAVYDRHGQDASWTR